MLDPRSVMVAVDVNDTKYVRNDSIIGYVHTSFAPSKDGKSLDQTAGQICFLCVDPLYPDAAGAASALIAAAENYLSTKGTQKIFGGSPSPSAPFYTGFYSGGEAVGILQSDSIIIDAFLRSGYHVHQKTGWFQRDLREDTHETTFNTTVFYGKFETEIREIPGAKTWWEGCTFLNGIWFDAMTYLAQTDRPIARLRTRITVPNANNILSMYGATWLASLMELRVHPDFAKVGVQRYVLDQLIRYLTSYNQIVQVDAHVAEDSPLFTLLRNLSWTERDSGWVFVKEL